MIFHVLYETTVACSCNNFGCCCSLAPKGLRYLVSKFDKFPKGSGWSKFPKHYALRWFKCKLKPPKISMNICVCYINTKASQKSTCLWVSEKPLKICLLAVIKLWHPKKLEWAESVSEQFWIHFPQINYEQT